MKDEGLTDTIAIIIVIVMVFAIMAILQNITEKRDIKKWNNGICTECGGKYEYLEAVGHKYDTDFIYRCNQCGKIIELDQQH